MKIYNTDWNEIDSINFLITLESLKNISNQFIDRVQEKYWITWLCRVSREICWVIKSSTSIKWKMRVIASGCKTVDSWSCSRTIYRTFSWILHDACCCLCLGSASDINKASTPVWRSLDAASLPKGKMYSPNNRNISWHRYRLAEPLALRLLLEDPQATNARLSHLYPVP